MEGFMKKALSFFLIVLLVGMFVDTLAYQALAQTVNVKVRCNTSTCLDTLRSNHLVRMVGESKKGITPAISWSDGPALTNVGGDYWETTITATPGDTIKYKFLVEFSAGNGTIHWSGWEGNLNAGGAFSSGNDRVLIVGASDMTVPLQYYNGSDDKKDQFWTPFTKKQDTVAVYFRVNMAGETAFNPATQTVAVFGGLPLGGSAWPKIIDLTQEVNSRGGAFWSGVAYIAKTNVTTADWQNYKFVYAGSNWETGGNRFFPFTHNTINVTGDTTIGWVYFSNKAPSSTPATTVNVTFRCNTSTCLDTLKPYHIVGLNGESVKGIDGLVWGNGSNTIKLTNVGGDYWETTIKVQPGDVVHYKFITKYDDATMSGVNWGWEGDISNGYDTWTCRASVIGSNDTILPLQYYNGGTSAVAQNWKPFESKQSKDSVAVYFRVNMGGADFDLSTGKVDVRGSLPLGGDSWPTFVTLTREAGSVNGGSFFSGVAYVAKSSLTPGTTQEQYKFVIQPDTWESTSNRSFVFSSLNDTTIHWVYFNNFAPAGSKVTADVLFRLKLQALENAGLFNRNLGDKVAVTGPKGWPPSGFDPSVSFDTEPTMLKMTYDPDAKEWNLVETFTKYPNEELPYKYYIAWDTTRINPNSPNYIAGLQLSNGWEEPGVTGGADRKHVFTDQLQQTVIGDFGAEVQFFNSLHWKGAITTPIQVKFKIDMTPATNPSENPNTLFNPGTDSVWVQFDGCLAAVTQGLSMWGTDNRLLLSDLDGDGKYTGTWNMVAPTLYQFCYRLVYSSPGVDGGIMNGSGSAVLGRRYYQYVHPRYVTADAPTWPASFELAEMPWMLDELINEDPPDLDTPNGVENSEMNNPRVFALYQNYPNPFNPSTMISYAVPQKSLVRIGIYNILGQRIASLVDMEQEAGTHSIMWNSQNGHNQTLSSGVYFVKMEAGSFTQIKKMMLMK
jgi:hypothetical protein